MSTPNPNINPIPTRKYHCRRSLRLKDYDYSQSGAYFLTLCTHERQYLFGDIINDEMRLNNFGLIVLEEWKKSSHIRAEIELDEFIIMPNHVHGIVKINDDHLNKAERWATNRSPLLNTVQDGSIQSEKSQREKNTTKAKGPQNYSIGSFVAGFKSAVTRSINETRQTFRKPVWQRNYYEKVIRDEYALNIAREYVINNPMNWKKDKLYLSNF